MSLSGTERASRDVRHLVAIEAKGDMPLTWADFRW
jgi:hypothetical protein